MREARALLEFACQCYRMQNDDGRIFIHEHPASAQSWKEEEGIMKLAALPGVCPDFGWHCPENFLFRARI